MVRVQARREGLDGARVRDDVDGAARGLQPPSPSNPAVRRCCAAISTLALAGLACNPPSPAASAPRAAAPVATTPAPKRPVAPPPSPTAPSPVAGLDALRVAAAGRVVAIGDVHGDIAATRRALRLAGAIDERDQWIGGSLVVVQTGDQLDRGDDEQAILDLLDRLVDDARRAGGALVVLNGNHEVMNALGDLRYVTPAGLRDFDGVAGANPDDPRFASFPEASRTRAAAFAPGGPYARVLAKRHVAAIVGTTAFVHGGILPEHVDGLVALDDGVRAMLSGEPFDPALVEAAMDPQGPLWSRDFAWVEEPEVCERLGRSLAKLGVKRMVVGHTVQEKGITSACEGRVWRIDVGLAAHYGGPTEVLEIDGDTVRPLRAGG
jgi:hypothetical protein